MRIVHLSTNDLYGGAARATYLLHKALTDIDLNSTLLVLNKSTDDPTTELVHTNLSGKIKSKIASSADYLPLKLFPKRQREMWSPGLTRFFPIENNHYVSNADLISLYWVCGGFLSAKAIGNLLRLGKPLIWRLSDMWPFTGGCHYAASCDRYQASCGRCPQLGSSSTFDLSRLVWSRKKHWWQEIPFTVVSPSNWLAECARRSSLFRNKRIEVIPTGINIDVFKPIPKDFARNLLSLPTKKRLILFGAANPSQSIRKGWKLVDAALKSLTDTISGSNPDLAVFGSWKSPIPSISSIDVHVMGFLHDEISMALLYSASDVFLSCSTQDNFPNTILEALACGTPCVAFNVGGISEIIDHKSNGYLAKPYQIGDLAQGLAWVLENDHRRSQLSLRATEKISRTFSSKKQALQYFNLYCDLLNLNKSQKQHETIHTSK